MITQRKMRLTQLDFRESRKKTIQWWWKLFATLLTRLLSKLSYSTVRGQLWWCYPTPFLIPPEFQVNYLIQCTKQARAYTGTRKFNSQLAVVWILMYFQRIITLLLDCCREGFPSERIEAALHSIELATKHQSSNFGLGLIMVNGRTHLSVFTGWLFSDISGVRKESVGGVEGAL